MFRLPAASILTLLAASPSVAGPRDELLRVAPPGAAIVIVVQNARDHFHHLAQSPFMTWLPTSPIGKRILNSSELRQLRDSAGMILRDLDTTPEALIDDVVGDAVVFAFSPTPPGGRQGDERAVILVRPRKIEALQRILQQINDLQSMAGELKSVNRKEHAGVPYFERRKTENSSEFYCFRGDVFAFSSTELDIQAVIDQDKAAPAVADKTPELVERMKRLGVADAFGVILINPRPLDAEVKARVAAAKQDELRFLERFGVAWAALDTAAIYAKLDAGLELGVSFRFHPGKLPADLKKWLTGPAEWSRSAGLIPADAIVGITGNIRAVELIDLVTSVAPVEAGKPGVKEFIGQTLGPFFGRDKLATVLNSLGPNWAAWAEPPVNESFLPTIVAALEITGDASERDRAEKALVQGIEFGFQLLRVGYNSKHTDQIELKEETRNGVVIRSLVNDKGFPPGFRPSFAVVKGYLVIATSPEPIQRFTPPATTPGQSDRTLARLSGVAARAYLQTHGARLAEFLIEMGIVADAKATRETIDTLAAAFELIDSVQLVTRPDENGLQIALLIKPARPLKK
jgi:hypothetical protein